MKKLFVCLSFIMSCSAFAESIQPIEPELLKALLDQAGTLKMEDNIYSEQVTVSEALSQTMGYPYDGDKNVTHECEWVEESEWTCRFVVNTKYGNDFTTESAIIITYKAIYDEKSDSFKVKSARIDYAG